MKVTLGSYRYAGQYQQRPTPAEYRTTASRSEYCPRRNRCTLARAKIDLHAMKDSERHLLTVQVREYFAELIAPLSTARAYRSADRIPAFLVGGSSERPARFQNSQGSIISSRHLAMAFTYRVRRNSIRRFGRHRNYKIIHKPFTMDQLVEAVKEVLDGQIG
jgi:hypothetical protein